MQRPKRNDQKQKDEHKFIFINKKNIILIDKESPKSFL